MRGPLHDVHARLGARFIEFAGFEMPVFYTSIKEEHARVRDAVGLFDVSHMGNLRIRGADAAALLSRCTTTDAAKIAEGSGVYTTMLRDDGTIIDDTIFYRLGPETYYMVPNAGMNTPVTTWLHDHARRQGLRATVDDETAGTCIFALQGPRAPDTLAGATQEVPPTPRFAVHERTIDGRTVLATTTGYTGETGYELFVDAADGPDVFSALLEEGAVHGILPIGLGARDTLRLEMAYALAGHEFKGGRSPLEANLAWTVKWGHDFIGKGALTRQKEQARHDRLVGLRLTGRGIAREGHTVVSDDDEPIGVVTSGTLSPSLDAAIALAYVRPGHTSPGTRVHIQIRDKAVPAEIVKTPFLRR